MLNINKLISLVVWKDLEDPIYAVRWRGTALHLDLSQGIFLHSQFPYPRQPLQCSHSSFSVLLLCFFPKSVYTPTSISLYKLIESRNVFNHSLCVNTCSVFEEH